MVIEALRGYVQLANGLTEVTRQRAQQAARQLLQQAGAESVTSGLTAKVGELAEEIVATSKSNRALLQAIVTNEVEGAVARLGFVRAEEVAALRRRLEKLERAAESSAGPAGGPTGTRAARTSTKAAAGKAASAGKAGKVASAGKVATKAGAATGEQAGPKASPKSAKQRAAATPAAKGR